MLTMVIPLIPSTLVTTAFAADAVGDGVDITSAKELADDTNALADAGVYKISGTRQNPVKITATDKVVLVLNNVSLKTATSPIELADNAKVTLVVPDGTVNTLKCTAIEVNVANNGKTAGILVPGNATLTIDRAVGATGTGRLTVEGGFGGAGIGGGAGVGYIEQRAANGNNGNSGNPGADADTYGDYNKHHVTGGAGGSGGQGGQGGRTGGAGGTLGTLTINAGVLNITGGAGAAGIGGGVGGTGEDGGTGGQGGTGSGGQTHGSEYGSFLYMAAGGVGGNGGGGAGGNGGTGGTGGDGGKVNITGGSVTVTGGDGAPDIGGGNGGSNGKGGNGGSDNTYCDFNRSFAIVHVQGRYMVYSAANAGGAGGLGADGNDGLRGSGGNGASVNITGGIVSLTNKTVSGGNIGKKISRDNRRGATGGGGERRPNPRRLHEENYTNLRINDPDSAFGAGGTGGSGGSAKQVVGEAKAGDVGILTISGTDQQNMKFLSEYNASASARPMSKNNVPLYRAVITAVDANNNETPVEGAVASITKDGVRYNNVSGNNGTITLWLPLDSYTLQNTDVIHKSIGWMIELARLEVTTGDNARATAKLGKNIVFAANTAAKVYTNGTDTPVTLTMDATALPNAIVTNPVRWFREPFQKVGAANNTEYWTDTFDQGYNAAGMNNRGEQTASAENNKQFKWSINENGRYWAEITVDVDGSSFKTVQLVEVKNIYREYSIQVRSQELNRNGGIKKTDEYGPLKTAIGLDYKAQYGFPWDLNGYNTTDVAQGTLIANPPLGYDTVSVYALDSKAKWYTAYIDTMNFERKDDRTGFKAPVSLTLNQAFLTNTYSDLVDGTQNHDISKYTIIYKPDGVPVAEVTIRGVVLNDDGTVKEEKWSFIQSYPEGVTEATVTGFAQKGYRIEKVLVNGQEKTLTNDNSIHLENLQGTQEKKYTDAIEKVEFVYVDNMTDVTVNTVLNDAKKDTANPTKVSAPYTVPVEIGTEKTFVPPVVEGYDCVGSNKEDYKIPSVAKGDSITFYYEKAEGNVTYQAVVGNTVLWTGKGTVTKGQIPEDKTPDKGVNNYQVDDNVATKYTITGTDTQYPNTNGQYDGVNDITVTYTYKHKTRNVVVEKYDITNTQTPLETGASTSYNVGGYEEIKSGDAPKGYKIVGDSSRFVKITEGTENLVVKFYYEASDEATVTVRLYASVKDRDNDNDGSKAFQTLTFPATFGVETQVNAPTMTGWEFDTAASNNAATKIVKPVKGGAAPVVQFVYKPVYYTATVKLMNEDGTKELPTDALPAGWTGKFEVQQGQGFTIAAPSIVNYKLADGEALEKSLNVDQIKDQKPIIFKYTKAEADLITITVKGVKDNKELYSYTKYVRKSATDVEIQVFTMNGCKLDNVEMGGTPVTATGGTYKINPQGTAQTVTATYSSNMADVTINAYYKDITKTVEGFTPFKVKAEIGKPYSYGALAIPGYDNDGAAPSIADVKAQDNVLNYYFTKQIGNVIYQLVEDGHDDHILATKSKNVTKGDAIDATSANAPEATNWKLKDASNGAIEGATADGKFDGIHAVTVTYVAVPKTKDVTIVRYDVDTNQRIPLTDEEQGAGKTLTATLETGKMHTLQKAKYLPKDYTISGNDTVEVYVEDDAEGRTVNMYFRRRTDENVNVVLYYNEDGKEHEIQRYVVQRKPGTTIKVTAPDMAYKGYTRTVESKNVLPTDNEVKFEYTVQYNTVEIELLDENDTKLTTPNGYELTRKVRKGEGIVLTAPSILGYTLKSTLVVSKSAADLETAEGRKVTFKYQNTAAANYVTHTIILKNKDENKEITRYNSTVAKGTGKTTYYAPVQIGFQCNTDKDELSNNQNGEVTFIYTKSAATITIHFVDKNTGTALPNVEDTELSGYEKGQTVMVAAPALTNYALAGQWKDGRVEAMTGVTATLTLSTTAANNEITFAYEDRGEVTFVLKDEAGNDIKVINGVAGEPYSVAAGGKLDLRTSGWAFNASHQDNSPDFKTADASVTVGLGEQKSYELHYTRITRNVTYKYWDVTNGENSKTEINFISNDNPTTVNVGENFTVPTPQIPGYTPTKLSKTTFVTADSTGAVEVTFEYIKKATGSVTVKHILKGTNKVITSYIASGSVGEWFTATKLATDMNGITADGRYTFTESDSNKATQTVKVTAAGETITFEYEPNYVTVNTYISVDGAETEYQTGIDVVKITGTQKLYAPSKTGYVLKGITVKKNVVQLEDGSATTFPDYWNNNELTLTNLTSNVKVVYYYEKINDNIKDYQATITVKDQYETYGLGGRTETVIKDVNAEIASKAYDGYALIAYQIGDSADQKQQVEADKANNFKLTHKFDKNTTVTFFYGRADGSAVVPGGDMDFGTDDDVIIKPKDDNKPSVNPDGSVNVPNGAEVVTPNGTVLPPHGSIVKPDGTIVAPGTDGTTKPGITIDPSNPSDNGKYIFVQYKANGGVGESYTQMVKKDADTVELKSVASLFTRKGYTATGWNTNDKGLGDSYTAGSNRINKNLVLYAQWKADEVPSGTYTAKVVLKSNGASDQHDVEQTIASDTANPILATLQANPFTVKTNLAGWTFRGWNTAVNGIGTYYADQGKVSVADKGTLPLFAQWAKDGIDGSITVPGKDNIPGTENDVTVKPGNSGQLKRDDATGTITVPNGGSAVKKDNEIDMPNGGTVKPDGEISIKQPDGTTIVVKPDGTIETGDPTKTAKILTYKSGVTDVKDVKVYFTDKITVKSDVMTREGYKLGQWLKGDAVVAIGSEIKETTDLTAKWFKVDADGAITVPGKDGAVDAPQDKDNVTVKPGADGKLPSVDENGNVKVPEGGTTVVTPDGSVVVPGGSIVEPDGTIKDDQGTTLYPTKGEDGLDKTPTGYIKVTYKSGIAGVQDYVQLVKGTEVDIITNNVFGDVPNKTFLYWNGANGKEFTETTVTSDTILTAQWKDAGSVILSVADSSKVKTVNVAGTDENVLIMSGKWTKEEEDVNYTIPVLVDGKPAAGDLRWYVDAESYADEFGFTDSVLTGDDIIAINAQSGEIRVKNSGIVRVSCESVTDSSIKLSFVLVVPGDITQDGLVDMDDVDYVAEFATDNIHFTDSAADAYLKLLGDMDASNTVDLDDIDYLIDIATYLKEI